jgi:hypothetical protein
MSDKKLKMWFITLVEYDEFGNATILKHFRKDAVDSYGKQKKKETIKTKEAVMPSGVEEVW